MAGKTISLLSAAGSLLTNDNAVFPLANPLTGVATKVTLAQAKSLFQTKRTKYVATGAEGTTLTISALAGKSISLVTREGSVLYDTASAPDSTEYTWNGTSFGFSITIGAGERFIILYQ